MPLPSLHLTPAERLTLFRRRKGWSQPTAARHYKVGLTSYRLWEAGKLDSLPTVQLGALKPNEHCFILRRRSGLTQKTLAKKIGVCRFYLYGMELGQFPADRLMEYWVKASA